MKITCILLDEHRIIEQVLNCLERMAERCEFSRELDDGPAQDAVAFLRGFIERCHDCKVETRILPAIQAMGVSAEECLKCPMRQNRRISSFHLDAMESALEPARAGSLADLDKFAEHARAYIDMTLDWIARQEDNLLPLIASALGKVDKTLLEMSDRECGDHDGCRDYIEVANRLAENFDVPRATIIGPECGVHGDTNWRSYGDKASDRSG